MKTAAVVLSALALASQVSAHGPDFLARFDGGIGVIPVAGVVQPANADGTFANVTRNIVRGVAPGGGPWRIGALSADIYTNGDITVRGRGLLLASGNSIGQNANQRVFATLICESSLPFSEHSTDLAGVPLAPNGDFRIDDVLSSAPAGCASPVLLIRSASLGVWFAAGVPKIGDDN